MKVSSSYLELLRTTEPNQIAAYLKANGWGETYRESNRYSLWDKKSDEIELEQIMLPLNTKFSDYADRVQDILRITSEDKQNDEKTILSRIRNSSFEIVRLLVEQDDFRNGSLPVSGGIALFQNARNLLLASACSTVDKRPTYREKKPTEALAFMEDVRLGQSVLGSYGISLLIPTTQGEISNSSLSSQSVTLTLMKSLSSLMDLVNSDEQIYEEDIDAVVRAGVNAELLDSLSKIITRTNADNLTVQLDQSLDSSIPFDAPKSIKIPSDVASDLKEMGAFLRGDRMYANVVLRGFVTDLSRGTGEKLGKVTIQSEFDNRMRKIQVEFDDAVSYENAIVAHRENRTINVRGDLLLRKNRYRLVDATSTL
jgi:hypothetical protein